MRQTLSLVALVGILALTSATASVACPYRDALNRTNTVDSITPNNPVDAIVDQPNTNKFGVVGVIAAVATGLLASGLFLKQRFARDANPALLEAPEAELPLAKAFEMDGASTFAIVVPPEALKPLQLEDSESSESELTRV
ncbi:MAG: hypothetical protein HC769_33400 [Cyanobacteria bacterium CRU_2_1]|nr:hypothetical protein [Cyanobacteria bacterium RU_5_0]NJR63246.1 hypothetical protein [Cyanobacteria bacterium CRU_2_1]